MSDTSTDTKNEDKDVRPDGSFRLGNLSRSTALVYALGLVMGAVGAWSFSAATTGQPGDVSQEVQDKIRQEFTNTKFVDFNQTPYGLIEGITAKNVYYFNQEGTVAFVGEILDMDKKLAVTVERRKHLARFSDLDSIGNPGNAQAAAAPSKQQPGAAPQRPEDPSQVDMTGFPEANYITHNKGAGEILYVVSDFNCGFCKRLYEQLKDVKDIEIREIPVQFLGGDSGILGAHALCSDDKSSAAHAIFEGNRSGISTCEAGTKALEQNTAWAKEIGIGGTPALIKADGSYSSGFREIAAIRAFLTS